MITGDVVLKKASLKL